MCHFLCHTFQSFIVSSSSSSSSSSKIKEIKKSIAKERELKQREQLKSILDSEDLTEIERKKIEICQEPQTG